MKANAQFILDDIEEGYAHAQLKLKSTWENFAAQNVQSIVEKLSLGDGEVSLEKVEFSKEGTPYYHITYSVGGASRKKEFSAFDLVRLLPEEE
jgi:hypothetical protein